jgi:hypothetical protein
MAERQVYSNCIEESDPPMEMKYVHGYTARESERLVDQATTLAEILHSGTVYPAGSNVLSQWSKGSRSRRCDRASWTRRIGTRE